MGKAIFSQIVCGPVARSILFLHTICSIAARINKPTDVPTSMLLQQSFSTLLFTFIAEITFVECNFVTGRNGFNFILKSGI